MSDPPNMVTGNTEAPSGETQEAPPVGGAGEERRRRHDLWMTGTEVPPDLGRYTDEGSQEMLEHEDEGMLAEQLGTLVSDDYLEDPAASDEETQIVNMGPQHPATHGVLRLQVELEGETIRRAKPIIGYLHTGMEKTAERLSFLQGPTNVTRMDYLSPFFNELCFSLATERLLGIEIPPRGPKRSGCS